MMGDTLSEMPIQGQFKARIKLMHCWVFLDKVHA